MPNHVHALVSTGTMPEPPALGRIIGAFKSITTRDYTAGAKSGCWQTTKLGLWQRGYYDHVVRDEADEARIVEYIHANPIRWATDPENPVNPLGAGDEHRDFPRASVGKPVGR